MLHAVFINLVQGHADVTQTFASLLQRPSQSLVQGKSGPGKVCCHSESFEDFITLSRITSKRVSYPETKAQVQGDLEFCRDMATQVLILSDIESGGKGKTGNNSLGACRKILKETGRTEILIKVRSTHICMYVLELVCPQDEN